VELLELVLEVVRLYSPVAQLVERATVDWQLPLETLE